MQLEVNMLSEIISKAQKDKRPILLTCESTKVDLIEVWGRIVITRNRGGWGKWRKIGEWVLSYVHTGKISPGVSDYRKQ
jgi:hypothetical protein